MSDLSTGPRQSSPASMTAALSWRDGALQAYGIIISRYEMSRGHTTCLHQGVMCCRESVARQGCLTGLLQRHDDRVKVSSSKAEQQEASCLLTSAYQDKPCYSTCHLPDKVHSALQQPSNSPEYLPPDTVCQHVRH